MDLKIDTRDFERVLLPLAGMAGEVDKAIRAALKRTGDNMTTNIARQIKQHSFLKPGEIRQALSNPRSPAAAGASGWRCAWPADSWPWTTFAWRPAG